MDGHLKIPAAAPTINFIPNDPGVADVIPMRVIPPSGDRPAGRAAFAFEAGAGPAAPYAPGTSDFAFWQSREAALRTLSAMEAFGNITAWCPRATSPLPLRVDAFEDTSAYYTRSALVFCRSAPNSGAVYTAASTDCVSHEVGHAVLDSIRSDLYDSNCAEHAAFHEAFADCVSLITALADRDTRRGLIAASPDLSAANAVEAHAEELARVTLIENGPDDAASQPRRARNAFQWAVPTTLPTSGPPATLTAQPHSLCRVFTGCFYDLLRALFNNGADRTDAGLAVATHTAAALLLKASRHAVESVRFFEAVGVAMLDQDQQAGGNNADVIRGAFGNHGIALASSDVSFRQRARLAGGSDQRSPSVSQATISAALRERLRAVTPLTRRQMTTALGPATKFLHMRTVDLTGVSPLLKDVVSLIPEPVVTSDLSEESIALQSPMPDLNTTADEARFFASMLSRNDQISTRTSGRALDSGVTHAIRTIGGKKVLTRLRVACGCAALASRRRL